MRQHTAVAAALLAALTVALLAGCRSGLPAAGPDPAAPGSVSTAGDPLADIESTLDGVERDLDTDTGG